MTDRPASADHAALRLQAFVDTHTGWRIDADVREVVADRKRLVQELARADQAVELLHSLILRDLPNDGSEIPQPEDPWWADHLDRIVTEAAAIYAAATGEQRTPDLLEAADSWSRAQADDEQRAQQVKADLRAARDMLRRPGNHTTKGPA